MNYNKSSYVFSYFGLANQLILDVNKDIIIECIDLMCKKQYFEFIEETLNYSDIGMVMNYYSNDK